MFITVFLRLNALASISYRHLVKGCLNGIGIRMDRWHLFCNAEEPHLLITVISKMATRTTSIKMEVQSEATMYKRNIEALVRVRACHFQLLQGTTCMPRRRLLGQGVYLQYMIPSCPGRLNGQRRLFGGGIWMEKYGTLPTYHCTATQHNWSFQVVLKAAVLLSVKCSI